MAPDPFESNATATLDEEADIGGTEPIAETPEFEEATADPDPVPAEDIAGDEVAESAAPDTSDPPKSTILIRKSAKSVEAAETQPPELTVHRGIVVRLASMLLWPIVGILTLLDAPFAGLGAGFKSILGLIAMATSIVAAATWGAVLFIPPH